MDIWEILGIPETEDLDTIRRAYAKKLKEVHPEEDPEGFQRLHAAYQAVRKLARGAESDSLSETQPQKEPLIQPAQGSGLSSELLEAIQCNPLEGHPAVTAFCALYTGKQRRERKQWDLYFTAPEFLTVWREGDFTALLARIVAEQEGDCPPSKEFQAALAVAYQIETVSGPGGVEVHQAPGGQFEGMEAICAIAVRGPLAGRLRGNDLVLSAAYADYLKLMDMAQRGWTDEGLRALDSLLWKYTTAYVKEKCTGDCNNERNVVSLRLLNHFFGQKGIPAEVYEVLWNRLDLNSAIFGRGKVLHGVLRDLCLERAPEVCAPRENFTELTKAYDAITYHQNVSEEEMGRQVDAFFDREDFQRAVRSRPFMQNHTFWSGGSTGVYFLNRLIALYEEHPQLPLARMMRENAQATIHGMEERHRLEVEAQRLHRLAQEEITPDSCTLSNPLFFRWYLQAAFFQAADQEGGALMDTVEQELASLPQWDRRLAEQGLSRTISLKRQEGERTDEVELTARFHQFYIEYQLEGQTLSMPILPFWSMEEMEDNQFFLFLPMMAAFQEEQDQVADCIQKRLARLGLPDETLLTTLAKSMAGEVACLMEQGENVTVTRPAFFGREADGALCFCQWYYASSQLVTIRRSLDGLELLGEYCREDVFSLQQAEALAGDILDELFAPEQAVMLASGFSYSVRAEYYWAKDRTWAPEEVDNSLIEQLLQEFQNKRISRLAFTTGPMCLDNGEGDAPSKQVFCPQYHIVLLWNSCRPNEASTCALLRFDDRGQDWEALIADRDAYMNTDSKQTKYVPFRMGELATYRLHQSPKRPVDALIALLNGRAPDPGQWSSQVYLNNAIQRYYVARRTVGGFPYERTRMSKTLRNRYVLGKHPARFATQEAGGALYAQDVTLYNRSWVGDLLARFEMGKLERLVLTWKLEDDSVHLVLLHEKGAEGECFLAAVVQDTTRQIDYLVANVADYLDEGDGRKAPLIPFQNLRVQDFLLHGDFYRIRDFLDCFLVSLPDYRPILSPFGAFSSGPKKLVKAGFDAHRTALLGET